MMGKRFLEFVVGLFIIAGAIAIFLLALKVSGLSQYSKSDTYVITANFEDVGDLKVRAPVTIAGVRIGEVTNIVIDTQTFMAKVTMIIDKRQKDLPVDSSASILTAGLIGANYIAVSPGYAQENLKNNGVITETHPAIILENLISQVIYQIKGDKNEDKDKKGKKS